MNSLGYEDWRNSRTGEHRNKGKTKNGATTRKKEKEALQLVWASVFVKKTKPKKQD